MSPKLRKRQKCLEAASRLCTLQCTEVRTLSDTLGSDMTPLCLGILARETEKDLADMLERNYNLIDLVVCNLYPFQKRIAQGNLSIPEAVEEIDIGLEFAHVLISH